MISSLHFSAVFGFVAAETWTVRLSWAVRRLHADEAWIGAAPPLQVGLTGCGRPAATLGPAHSECWYGTQLLSAQSSGRAQLLSGHPYPSRPPFLATPRGLSAAQWSVLTFLLDATVSDVIEFLLAQHSKSAQCNSISGTLFWYFYHILITNSWGILQRYHYCPF